MTEEGLDRLQKTSAATLMAAGQGIKKSIACRRAARSRAGGRRDPLLELLLGRRADLARGELAVLEQHQRRDRHNAVFGRDARILVDVQLDDLDLAVERIGNLFQCR